jgi:hypothetical protein
MVVFDAAAVLAVLRFGSLPQTLKKLLLAPSVQSED